MKKQLLLFENTNVNVANINQNQYLKAKKKPLKRKTSLKHYKTEPELIPRLV